MRILSLVFLYSIQSGFHLRKYIAKIIRKRYDSDTVKQFQKFEKLDYKVCKNQATFEFLKLYQENGLTPKFLNLKLANSTLRLSNTYKQCQFLLPKEEIESKVSVGGKNLIT